ncbi:MAG TPA: FAD:protein FMN transferase [Verrucomicrobiae bacterium]|nr:FAD:protein FMN transferase [Verrucomicrobiae bacterium]
MQRVAVARNAMATRFEIVLCGENATSLRAAGEEALDEIERLEAQLSIYRPSSEIANINARAAREPVRVEPALFRLLQRAKQLSEETEGAFDITIAPLMRIWGLMGTKVGLRVRPSGAELAEARACVGMGLVELNPKNFTIRFVRPGVMLDLGAIGKGYAIEQAAEILRETGVTRALIHGGTSTVCAIGGPWKVAIDSDKEDPLTVVELTNMALSVSAVWGKSFQIGDKTYGHVLDPRTGKPVNRALLAAVILPSATETDALSTALLTVGVPGHKQIQTLRSGMRSLVLSKARKVSLRGIADVRVS